MIVAGTATVSELMKDEPMPAALIKKIEASEKFNQGYATVEYMTSALLDMALHGQAGQYNTTFGSALGAGAALDGLIAFNPIVNGTIGA